MFASEVVGEYLAGERRVTAREWWPPRPRTSKAQLHSLTLTCGFLVKRGSRKRPGDPLDNATERCVQRQVGGEKMPGSHETGVRQQHPNEPHGQPGADRRLRPGTITRSDRCIKP